MGAEVAVDDKAIVKDKAGIVDGAEGGWRNGLFIGVEENGAGESEMFPRGRLESNFHHSKQHAPIPPRHRATCFHRRHSA